MSNIEIAQQYIDTALGSAILLPSTVAKKSAGAQKALNAFREAAEAARASLTEDGALTTLKALRSGTAQQLLNGVLRWKKAIKAQAGGYTFLLEDKEGLVANSIIAALDTAIRKIGG